MKTDLQIVVPKPCHENYSSFKQTPPGGFCTSCQMEVIDFTSWSDDRLKLYFKNRKGKTCGRFLVDQVKTYSGGSPGHARTAWISTVFAGLLLLLISRLVFAQNTAKPTTEQYQQEVNNVKIPKPSNSTVRIIGTVTSSETGHTMAGVNVTLKRTSMVTSTDAFGKFALDLPNKDSSQFIVFSFNGFKTVEYLHNVTRPSREIAVDMEPRVDNVTDVLVGVLGGAEVVYRKPKPREIARDVWWWLTGG